MNIDSKYQLIVDQEIKRISNSDLEWIKYLELSQNHTFEHDKETYTGVLTYIYDKEMHTVTLKLERKLLIGYRSFLAGFQFDINSNLYPIREELLYTYH